MQVAIRERPPSAVGTQIERPSTPSRARTQHTVLVIEDEPPVQLFFARVLSAAGYSVLAAASAQEGIAAALSHRPDLVLLDLRLPDQSGIEVMRRLRARDANQAVVVVSAFLDVTVTIQIMKLGALEVLEKPVTPKRLLDAVSAALLSRNRPAADVHSHSVAERWAQLVLKVSDADEDFRTMEHWARLVTASASSLREICRLVGIAPHDARDFARTLGAIIRSRRYHCPIEPLLDVSDRRTLHQLLEKAGIEGLDTPVSTEVFLARQRFLQADSEALRVLRQLLDARDET